MYLIKPLFALFVLRIATNLVDYQHYPQIGTISAQQITMLGRRNKTQGLTKYLCTILICVLLNPKLLVSATDQGWTDSLGLEPLQNFDPIRSPRVALLLAFPKSGSTYIQNVLHKTTNLTTANNYGMTMINGQQVNTRQVWLDRTNGPFRQNGLKIPESGYILTKSHCGGWCYNCGPVNFVMSKTAFHRECLVSYRHNQFVIQKVQYDGKLVGKAIHLIRDPFSNIVSRFLRYEERKNDPDFDPQNPTTPTGYPMTIDGFQQYCQAMNKKYLKQDAEWFGGDTDSFEAIKFIPCRTEFIKYFRCKLFFMIVFFLTILQGITMYDSA